MSENFFTNTQVRTQALGCALDDYENTIYYLSTAAPPQALKSIWASAVKNNKASLYTPWTHGAFSGAIKMKTIYNPLGNQTSYQHMVSLSSDPRLIAVCDHRGLNTLGNIFAHEVGAQHHPAVMQARQHMLSQHMDEVYARFTHLLNAHTDVPVLPAWAPILWHDALENGLGLSTLDTYGDCIAAWIVHTDYDWLGHVQQLLVENKIQFAEQKDPSA